MLKENKKFALKVNKIKKKFDNKTILDDVSFSLYFGEKIGFIGQNGAGKSTLMKIIMRDLEMDDGDIEIFKNFDISYLPQEIQDDIFVKDYLELKNKNQSNLLNILKDFGFNEEILLRKISTLSGGQKTKIFLTKIILEKSPIILLDEPTNNLDKDGLEKLEEIIKNSNSAFLIISHDRKFLDETVSKIIELDSENHKIKIYTGNYSDYKLEKENYEERQQSLFVENQRQKKKIKDEVNRQKTKTSRNMNASKMRNDTNKLAANKRIEGVENSAGKNLKRAKDKLEKFDEMEGVKFKRPLIIDFSEMKHLGNKVLEIKDLRLPFGFSGKINLEIFAGDRLLVEGKNGSGKTTFIKEILSQNFSKISQNILWGETVKIGYLPQDFSQNENLDEKFIDYFMEKTEKNITDSRKIINRFGFFDEEINLKISELSPGLRGRGRIAVMLANNPNVLILDEPTNNLDLEVLEEFEKALKDFLGTIIFTSHDRYFVRKMKANKFLRF